MSRHFTDRALKMLLVVPDGNYPIDQAVARMRRLWFADIGAIRVKPIGGLNNGSQISFMAIDELGSH